MLSKAKTSLGLGIAIAILFAGADQITPISARTEPASLSLAPRMASPGVRIHVAAVGFRPGESVAIHVTDPMGTEFILGQITADGHGGLGMDLSPGGDATNGDNLVTLVAIASGSTSSSAVTVIGAADESPDRFPVANAAAGGARWRMFSIDAAACGPCLFVHGEAP